MSTPPPSSSNNNGRRNQRQGSRGSRTRQRENRRQRSKGGTRSETAMKDEVSSRRGRSFDSHTSLQDILIAFMPYLKANHPQAVEIHSTHAADSASLLLHARAFLESNPSIGASPSSPPLPATTASSTNDSPVLPTLPAQTTSQRRHQSFSHAPPPGLGGGRHPSPLRPIGPPSEAPAVSQVTREMGQLWNNNTSTTIHRASSAPRARSEGGIIGLSESWTNSRSSSPWSTDSLQASTPPPGLTLPAAALSTTPPPKSHSPLPPPPKTTSPKNTTNATTTTTLKKTTPPKRLYTDFDEQPGRIVVHGIDGQDASRIVLLEPRQELTAQWSVPRHIWDQYNRLTVGLFRRGAVDNAGSIISKSIGRYTEGPNGWLTGSIPFYSPRTPGHVVFRLYSESQPLYTLAMGPSLHVVARSHPENTLRFLLSNLKSKKNPTSLANLHSLGMVLPVQSNVVAACVSESRKVLVACHADYRKQVTKLAALEAELQKVDDTDTDDYREKMRQLLSGRASSERKWRDSQWAMANIVQKVMPNSQLEMALWCLLSEEFASASPDRLWFDPLPSTIEECLALRAAMQKRTLQFVPSTTPLEQVLYKQGTLNPGAVTVFNGLSTSMGRWFHQLHVHEAAVVQVRQWIREFIQHQVQQGCKAFQQARVLIFGSSANGFGSPLSDMDMCLDLPQPLLEEEGTEAMGKLAEFLETVVDDVDTSRLGARIPIVMFRVPSSLWSKDLPHAIVDGMEFVECDLSLRNPLAVLNTAYLRSYAEINPSTRVLASIIKKWAKARDINNPARHTLSSYGYILMLLHFLTSHQKTPSGVVTKLTPGATPLLPNLHWMDPRWPTAAAANAAATPYTELASLPTDRLVSHPFVDDKKVNTYFCGSQTALLQQLFPGQDMNLAVVLAAFFRYYAYDFDYKHCVVSLHTTANRGPVSRETKAERCAWRNYSAALTIEDPFEIHYDVAHVLRGGYYHRIRREFAVAYTKIVSAAVAVGSGNSEDDLLEVLCEPVETKAASSDEKSQVSSDK